MTNYRTQWFSTIQESHDAFEEHKEESMTGWRNDNTRKQFGMKTNELLESMRNDAPMIRWVLNADVTISVPFDGTPFVWAGKRRWQCHQGYDRDAPTKKKRKLVKEWPQQIREHSVRKTMVCGQITKKCECPAMAYELRVIRFPQFTISNDTKMAKSHASLMLKEALSSGRELKTEERFYLKLPNIDVHKNHPTEGLGAFVREGVDPVVRNKAKELYHNASALSTKQLVIQLESFVNTQLFRNEEPPDILRRKYYPLGSDIKNILSYAKKANTRSENDQENLKIIMEELRVPGDFLHLQLRTATENFLFVYQTPWQMRLLSRYGNELTLMDATYRTTKYSLPLVFLCVLTNVGYMVVAILILQDEEMPSYVAGLSKIKNQNPFWKAKNFMVDYSSSEIGALKMCFPDVPIFICDFHREKAWKDWFAKKRLLNVNTERTIDMLRNIADADSQESLDEALNTFKSSTEYSNEYVKRYFEVTWEPVIKMWVRYHRNKTMVPSINTNNGVESQNRWLKHSFLENFRRGNLSDLVKTLLRRFLPRTFKKYGSLNVQMLSTYRLWSKDTNEFLVQRPSRFLTHVRERFMNTISACDIQAAEHCWLVVGENDVRYDVVMGDEDIFPSCQCYDWQKYKLPCKHMCAIMTWHGMETMSERLSSHPLYTVDLDAGSRLCSDVPDITTVRKTRMEAKEITNIDREEEKGQELIEESVEDILMDLPTPFKKDQMKGVKERSKAITLAKGVIENLYLIEEYDVLAEAIDVLSTLKSALRKNIPTENGLPRRDLTPKKNKPSCNVKALPQKKYGRRVSRKQKEQNRYGKGAEQKAQSIIASVDEAERETKTTVSIIKRSAGKMLDLNDTTVWKEKKDIVLMELHRNTLMHPTAWYGDRIICFFQDLLIDREFQDVGGFADVVVLRSGMKPNPLILRRRNIQIHSVPNHWVVTYEVDEKVILYDSSKHGHIYKEVRSNLALLYGKEMKNIELKCAQDQHNGNDCGPFAIANAIALAHNVMPETIKFEQLRMRDHIFHLICEEKVTMVPFSSTLQSNTENSSNYRVKIVDTLPIDEEESDEEKIYPRNVHDSMLAENDSDVDDLPPAKFVISKDTAATQKQDLESGRDRKKYRNISDVLRCLQKRDDEENKKKLEGALLIDQKISNMSLKLSQMQTELKEEIQEENNVRWYSFLCSDEEQTENEDDNDGKISLQTCKQEEQCLDTENLSVDLYQEGEGEILSEVPLHTVSSLLMKQYDVTGLESTREDADGTKMWIRFVEKIKGKWIVLVRLPMEKEIYLIDSMLHHTSYENPVTDSTRRTIRLSHPGENEIIVAIPVVQQTVEANNSLIFAVAHAIAACEGWSLQIKLKFTENKMKRHLYNCLKNRELEVFQHVKSKKGNCPRKVNLTFCN